MPETPVNTDAERLKDVEAVAAALLTADDGGNAEAILSATAHAGDCPFVAFPRAYTCSKCQGDHYRMLARVALDSRDAAIREAQGRHGAVIDEFARAKTDWMTWRTGMEAALREAREVLAEIEIACEGSDTFFPSSGATVPCRQLYLDEPLIQRIAALARSQPATPSPVPTYKYPNARVAAASVWETEQDIGSLLPPSTPETKPDQE